MLKKSCISFSLETHTHVTLLRLRDAFFLNGVTCHAYYAMLPRQVGNLPPSFLQSNRMNASVGDIGEYLTLSLRIRHCHVTRQHFA